jgi:hypothetical protein
MAIVVGYDGSIRPLGDLAYGGAAAVSEKQNVIDSNQARQRARMQRAQILAQQDQQQAALVAQARRDAAEQQMQAMRMGYGQQQQEASRQHDLDVLAKRQQFDAGQNDLQLRAREEYQNQAIEAQNAAAAQKAKFDAFEADRKFNADRLMDRNEFVQEGLKAGRFRYTPTQKSELQTLNDSFLKIRNDPSLHPMDREAAMRQVQEKMEWIKSNPEEVPEDERQKAYHEQVGQQVAVVGPTGQPIAITDLGRPLQPGDMLITPDRDGVPRLTEYNPPAAKGSKTDDATTIGEKVDLDPDYRRKIFQETKAELTTRAKTEHDQAMKDWEIASAAAVTHNENLKPDEKGKQVPLPPKPVFKLPTNDDVLSEAEKQIALDAEWQRRRTTSMSPSAMDPFGIVGGVMDAAKRDFGKLAEGQPQQPAPGARMVPIPTDIGNPEIQPIPNYTGGAQMQPIPNYTGGAQMQPIPNYVVPAVPPRTRSQITDLRGRYGDDVSKWPPEAQATLRTLLLQQQQEGQ